MKTLFDANKFYFSGTYKEEEKPLVSLDVFDTAIFRKVFKPTDILNLVEENVGHNFKEERIKAQDKVRRKNIHYTIMDIYNYLPFQMSPKEEIKTEILNCEPNPYILDLYNKKEADYIFISDMYLPSSVIAEMLEMCGYENPKVFVSCEHKAGKGDGKLFLKVEEILGKKIEKHIGDNYHCDIKGAQKAGITEVEYIGPAIYTKEIKTPELENVKLRKLLVDKELSKAPIEEKIGYQFAPLVLAFTKAVLDEAKEGQTIFFNARDSFILYIVARWILKTKKKIKYCRFSRKSCHFPNINTNYRIDSETNKKAMNFFRNLRISTIKELLEMFNFKGDYTNILRELGIEEDTPLNYGYQKNKILEKFIVAIQKDLFCKARESRNNFKAYINKLGMKNNDIFVDLGHFGSMQSIIRVLTRISLHGRYIHKFTNEKYLKEIEEDKVSFLPIGYIKDFTGIVETIFSEPVGTCIFYTPNGNVVLNKDTKYRKDVTKALLRGVLKGVKDMLEENIIKEDVLKIIDRFLKFPTLEEAEFGNSKIFENGSNEESLVWYDTNLIKRGKLKECYLRSYWKQAFKVLMENDSNYKFLLKEIKR